MINAAVVGMGTWGRTMVESLAAPGAAIRIAAMQTRTVKPDDEAFAKQHGLAIAPSYEAVLKDPKIDAVVLATPVSGHLAQIAAAAAQSRRCRAEDPDAVHGKRRRARRRHRR